MEYLEVGKSVSMKTLTARTILTYNCNSFYIDVEGEYSKLCQRLGGKVIKISQGKPSGINPFELEPDFNGKYEFLSINEKVSDIRALLSTITRNYMFRTLNSNEMTEIEIVVNEIYKEYPNLKEKQNQPTHQTKPTNQPNKKMDSVSQNPC